MNLKLGFAVAVQYALVAVMFWMWVRKDRGLGWVFLAFLVYEWIVFPWIRNREPQSYGDKARQS